MLRKGPQGHTRNTSAQSCLSSLQNPIQELSLGFLVTIHFLWLCRKRRSKKKEVKEQQGTLKRRRNL